MPPTKEELQAFYQNKLIQRLSAVPQWSVSDNKKRPLNVKEGIATKFHQISLYSYKNQGIAPLKDFDKLVPAQLTNRALRLNMASCQVIAVDIEPQYNQDRWNKWLTWMPVDYIEYSMHDGYHILVDVPNELLKFKPLQELLTKQTNIQFLENNESHKGIEFNFNNHFITLTRRVITDPTKYPFKQLPIPDQKTRNDRLKAFLLYIQKINKSAVSQTPIKSNLIQSFTKEEQKQAKVIAEQITPEQINHAKIVATNNATKNTGELDLSRVEWRFMSSIFGYYNQLAKSINVVAALQQDLQIANSKQITKLLKTPNIAALTIAIVAQNNLTSRPKWQTKRDNLPWLLYYGVKIVNYFTQQDQKEATKHASK